jgi:hypothetical protein
MREFTFDLVYGGESGTVSDLFARHEELRLRSLNAPFDECFWRLSRVAGPTAVLDQLERRHAEGGLLGDLDGEAVEDRYVECIERAARRRVLYTFAADPAASTVLGLVAQRFSPGTVVETLRQGDRQTWRLLLRPDATVGAFHEVLTERLGSGVRFRMGAIRDATAWRDQAAPGDVPTEQRQAVRAAVQAGYYEAPRQATLDEISAELGIPRSTLSYRLRRAESHLARAFVTAGADTEAGAGVGAGD